MGVWWTFLLLGFFLRAKHFSSTCSKMQVRYSRALWKPTGKANSNLQTKEQTNWKEHPVPSPLLPQAHFCLPPAKDKDTLLICFFWAHEADRSLVPVKGWLVLRNSWLPDETVLPPIQLFYLWLDGPVDSGTFNLTWVGILDASEISPKELWFPHQEASQSFAIEHRVLPEYDVNTSRLR